MPTIHTYTGNRFENNYKIAIIASEFNGEIVDKLLQDARQTLLAHQVENMTIIRVPGAFEIPFAARLAAPSHDAIIALGAVIRGETPHFDYVCQGCVEGINRVIHDTGVPVAFGILTTNTVLQAMERAQGKSDDTVRSSQHAPQGGGAYAATVALRLASLRRQMTPAVSS